MTRLHRLLAGAALLVTAPRALSGTVLTPARPLACLHRGSLMLLLALAAVVGVPPVARAQEAQESAARAHYRTGDAWLDAQLEDIDRYATQYPETFAAEVERYAHIPRAYVHGLVAQPGWNPGDAWYACFLARVLETDCRSVVRTRARMGVDGSWADVVGQLAGEEAADPAPALRLALADSYRRWDRGLEPDAALRRALQQRERERAAAQD